MVTVLLSRAPAAAHNVGCSPSRVCERVWFLVQTLPSPLIAGTYLSHEVFNVSGLLCFVFLSVWPLQTKITEGPHSGSEYHHVRAVSSLLFLLDPDSNDVHVGVLGDLDPDQAVDELAADTNWNAITGQTLQHRKVKKKHV